MAYFLIGTGPTLIKKLVTDDWTKQMMREGKAMTLGIPDEGDRRSPVRPTARIDLMIQARTHVMCHPLLLLVDTNNVPQRITPGQRHALGPPGYVNVEYDTYWDEGSYGVLGVNLIDTYPPETMFQTRITLQCRINLFQGDHRWTKGALFHYPQGELPSEPTPLFAAKDITSQPGPSSTAVGSGGWTRRFLASLRDKLKPST